MKKTNLLFLPYAGGSSYVYRDWERKLTDKYEIKPIELNGRGYKFGMNLRNEFQDILDDIYEEFKNAALETDRYIVFGHSMGAILAYYLVNMVVKKEGKNPELVVFSGQEPIHKIKKEYYHLQDDKTFTQHLDSLGGIPRELKELPEVLEIFLPILRADMKALTTREDLKKIAPINCNITVLYSEEDKSMDSTYIDEWKMYTNKECFLWRFTGNHFFINYYKDDIINYLNNLNRK